MQSNKQIKKREIFILKQKLIKQLGIVKDAQNKLLVAINECAYDELNKDSVNALKRSVNQLTMKNAIKHYINSYMQKLVYDDDLKDLESWKADN